MTDKPAQVSDAQMVDAFAKAMKAKLRKKAAEGFGGWQDCSPEVLQRGLYQHAGLGGDPVDVANFCAMLYARGKSLRGPRIT